MPGRKLAYLLPCSLNMELKEGDLTSSSHMPSGLVSAGENQSESGWNTGRFQ